jgi:hypothetical protein
MDLALTAIFRNEAPYLAEWIEFHRVIGFEHFYLFDNLSEDEPRKVLDPYISQGIATLVSWPIDHDNVHDWTEVQCLAYERALHWARGKAKWLAILDVDEFLFPVEGSLLNVLSEYEDFGGVGVNWQLYGTSNVAKVPEERLMIEMLNFKVPTEQVTNHHIKSIVRPERVELCDNAHAMTYKPGFSQVNTAKIPFEGCLSPTVEIDRLRINHYTLRDEHFLTTRKIPRIQKWWKETPEMWRQKYAGMNVIEDKSIHRFIASIILKKP